MIKKIIMTSSALALAMSINVQAADDDKTYLTSSDGKPAVSSSGECVVSSGMTAEQLEACGYKKPEAVIEVVATETAATVTMKVEEKITLSAEMLFDFDSAKLTDDAKAIIDERIDRFQGKVKATTAVSIVGHTDSSGPESYNQILSEKRAQSVADYIKSNAKRSDFSMEVMGKGESSPIASNDTREGRKQNRRVEVNMEGVIEKMVEK